MRDLTRREFIIASAAVATAASITSSSEIVADVTKNQFTLPDLGYNYADLEPVIDTETMMIHHSKHHQTYIDKLNEAIQKTPELTALSLDVLNKDALKYGDSIRNNAGGHYNHSLFWKLMAPVKSNQNQPSGKLLAAINKTFGSLDILKEQLNKAAVARFGSGWAWLVANNDGSLEIVSTANQDNPLMEGLNIKVSKPLIAIDVWEHAYYLKYRNKRAEYLSNWWKVINWNEVNRLHSQQL